MEDLTLRFSEEGDFPIANLQYAPNLTSLELYCGQVRSMDYRIPNGSLEVLKSLKKLSLVSVSITKDNLEEMARMENLEGLQFHGCGRIENKEVVDEEYDDEEDQETVGMKSERFYSNLVILKDKITSLEFSFPRRTPGAGEDFDQFPEFIYSLTNLKELTINNCLSIETISDKIKELKNLKYINLFNTNVPMDVIKSYLDDLKYLVHIEAGKTSKHLTFIRNIEPTELTCSKAEALGYKCCSHCKSIYEDKDGLWGSENGKWCVIPDQCEALYDSCWSLKKGYSCCDHCNVNTVDKHGLPWGVMNKKWCGILPTCDF